MKKLFTKATYIFALAGLFAGAALPAVAQYTSKTITSGAHASAIAKDASGNTYVVEDPSNGTNGEVVKYTNGSGSSTVIYTGAGLPDNEGSLDDFPLGIVVASNGDVYVTTASDFGNGFYGNVIKLTFNGSTYSESTFITGTASVGEFEAMAIDASDNLYIVQYDVNANGGALTNGIPGAFEVAKYPKGSTSFTRVYDKLELAEFASPDIYSNVHGLAMDTTTGNLYVGDSFDVQNGSDGGHIYKLTLSGGTYSPSTLATNPYCTALATDASGNLYAMVGNTLPNMKLVEYTAAQLSAGGSPTPTALYTNLKEDGDWYPYCISPINNNNIFISNGDNGSTVGDYMEVFGTPTIQATNVSFSSTATTSTTVSWTNGNGSSRAVFMSHSSTGSPVPANSTTYQANTSFGDGTEIGSTLWFCIYNGPGTSVAVTNLIAGNTYRVMTLEYNGLAGAENYLQSAGTNNPNNVTTVSPVTINSINTNTGSNALTNATTVNYTVTFNAAETGLTSSNFSLTTSGVSGASIGTPTTSNNTVWTVPVTTGTGDGTIILNLANATGLSAPITNSLPYTGQTYTIDKTLPAVSIGSPSVSYANSSTPVSWSVSWSDTHLNTASINLTGLNSNINKTGTANFTSLNASPGCCATPISIQMTGLTGDGTIGFTMPAGSASDNAGNTAAASSASATVIVDNTAPTISISAPSVSATAGGPVNFTVTYSDANFNSSTLNSGNITLNTTSTANAGSIVVTGSGTTRTVTLSSITGDGSLGISIASATATDLAGNAAPASSASSTFTVDNTAPTALSLLAQDPSPTNQTGLDYQITFNEAVTGVDPSDFTAVTSSGVTAGAISVTQLSGTVYNLSIVNVNGNGTLQINLNSSGTGITDAVGNAISGGVNGDTFTVDQTAPQASGVTFQSNNANTSFAKVGDVVTLAFTASETVQTPAITIAGHNVTPVNTSGNSWSASYTETSGDTEGQQAFDLVLTDLAGNQAEYTSADASLYVTFDQTAPTATISAPSAASIATGSSGTITYTVTYADANFNTSSLSTGDITLNSTGSASGTVGLSGSGTSYTVTISSITGSGTLGITVAGGKSNDKAGNTDAGAGPSTTFDVLGNDATLSNIILNASRLTPAFASGVTSYKVVVGAGFNTLTVNPVTNDPAASLKINGVGVNHGATPVQLTVGDNPVTILVTAADGVTTQTYNLVVTRRPSTDARLVKMILSAGALSPVFSTSISSYTATVPYSIASVMETPTTGDPNATVTVNGTAVVSGTASGPISLSVGQNIITTIVTAQDGVTTNTYTETLTRLPSDNDRLSNIQLSRGSLSPTFIPSTTSYTASVANSASSVTVTPTAGDPAASITVNGTAVASGNASSALPLAVGPNAISIMVTAPDGTTNQTYMVTVTRAPSNNANLSNLKPGTGSLSPAFATATTSYTESVANTVSTITFTPRTTSNAATVTVNGSTVASGSASAPIPLNVGDNTISTVVTAEDGTTTKTYTVTVTRAPGSMNALYVPVGVAKPIETLQYAEDGIRVHQGISPNGDGQNDVFTIDGITNYPDNKLSIMNRSGQLVYEAKGYDNTSKAFDGHSNKTGAKQLPGTYFYSLEYTVKGVAKHKTGFIILKW